MTGRFEQYVESGPSSVIHTTIEPIRDKVVVRRLEEQTTYGGGIVAPDTAVREKPQEGEVIAVGTGRVLESGASLGPIVKPGDHVLFGKYSGTDIDVDDETLLLLREDEVLAVVRRTTFVDGGADVADVATSGPPASAP